MDVLYLQVSQSSSLDTGSVSSMTSHWARMMAGNYAGDSWRLHFRYKLIFAKEDIQEMGRFLRAIQVFRNAFFLEIGPPSTPS